MEADYQNDGPALNSDDPNYDPIERDIDEGQASDQSCSIGSLEYETERDKSDMYMIVYTHVHII